MFYRVVMNIIDMGSQIPLITNGVLPIAPRQMPRSALRRRATDKRSVFGKPLESNLIKRQRVAKSASPLGKVQMQCK